MSKEPTSAAEQAKRFETQRKLDMVQEWITLQAQLRQQAGVFGRMAIEMVWESGKIKRVKLTDEVTIDDLNEKQLELVLRGKSDENGSQ